MLSAQLKTLPISSINLDKDNPRIKQYLEHYPEITSEILSLVLSDNSSGDSTTSYRALRDSIKASKGIIHPIVVNHDENGQYYVIEGNTRLQIYKEFEADNIPGEWSNIVCLVYEQLTDIEKHEIRLQSHLVGPRDWDPYSKAKYLYHLSEEEKLPMSMIVDMCGGKANEITKYIKAYEYMKLYYEPYVKNQGYDRDPRDFSKFVEYQNSRIQNSILHKGYADNQFAKWVADGNVDKAQLVRIIPAVMNNEEAKSSFLKNNLTSAEKIIHAAELAVADLSDYPYSVLASELTRQLMNMSVTEINSLAQDPAFAEKLDSLEMLKNKLDFILDEVEQHES